MRKWFIWLGIIAVLLIGGYFVLSSYAVKMIASKLQKRMGPGFTLVEVKLETTCLSVRGIQYEDPDSKQRFLQIEELRIYPSLLSLFKRSLSVKEINLLQPSCFIYRTREGVWVGPWVRKVEEKEEKEVSERGEKKKRERVPIEIDRIRIRKGTIDLEDRKVGEPPEPIRLRDIDFEIKEIQYPLASSHSPFELRGKMKGRNQDGSIETRGWIDLKTTDLDAILKIREIEVETFKPYYRKKVSAEIESGTMDMESKIILKGKRIDVSGEMDFINLRIKKGGGTVFWIPAETLASLLEKKGNRVKAPFHVKGNLKDPHFKLQEALLTRIAFSLMEALGLPVKISGERLLEDMGIGTEGWKSIEELFKRKKEKKR